MIFVTSSNSVGIDHIVSLLQTDKLQSWDWGRRLLGANELGVSFAQLIQDRSVPKSLAAFLDSVAGSYMQQ